MPLLEFLLVGLAAGWMMGQIRRGKGKGYGLVKSLAIGVIGSMIGWFLMGFLEVEPSSVLVRVAMAFLGATVFFLVVGLFKKKKAKKSEGDEDE